MAESTIMRHVYGCHGSALPIKYDVASLEVSKIKDTLTNLSNDTLLDLHESAYLMAEEAESELARDVAEDAGELLEHTLLALPYLDSERAGNLYDQAMSREYQDPEIAQFVGLGLVHLSRVELKLAMPRWRRILTDEGFRKFALFSVDVVLNPASKIDLSRDERGELEHLRSD
jgi:hypothetical protein